MSMMVEFEGGGYDGFGPCEVFDTFHGTFQVGTIFLWCTISLGS